MRAAVFAQYGSPLEIRELREPTAGSGEAIVDVVAAPVLAYAQEIFAGERPYSLPTPLVPGCGAVGRINRLGPDATHLMAGDWVSCDPTVRSRDGGLTPDIVLQGWDARGEGGRRLQAHYRDGPFAQRMRLPLENLLPLGPITEADAARWCALNTVLIPMGGLAGARFSPGEVLLVNGASGHFGSATVAVALAMGAARVVAAGRNAARLGDLADRFGSRVAPVVLTGSADDDRAAIRAAASRIDCVLDFLPPSAPASAARTAIMTVRPGGRVVLMGGIGTTGGEDLALPYSWIMLNDIEIRGKWMYPRDIGPQAVGLVQAGLLDLDQFAVASFGLDDVNVALAHAAAHAGPFRLTVLRP